MLGKSLFFVGPLVRGVLAWSVESLSCRVRESKGCPTTDSRIEPLELLANELRNNDT